MMYFLYAFLTTLFTLLASPVLAITGIANWRGMRHRVGVLPAVNGSSGRPVIWFHAASVGEVTGLAAIVSAFIRAQPDWRVVVSTMTRTGLNHARRMVPDVHGLCLVPLDVPVIVRRAFVRFSPRALVFVEGELWPCLIEEAARSGCRVALVNGRMSDRSYPRYRRIRPLTRRMLSRLTLLCAQTETDANRFIDCGASPDRVIVTGNMKVDLMSSTLPSSRTALRQMLGLPEAEPVIIAGSTRPGEEEMVFEAFIVVRTRHPDARLICAPRHLDRLPDVQRSLREHGLPFIRRSALQSLSLPTTDHRPPTTEPVILLDTMGELSGLYAVADAAFVGATLVPLGGHNLLEPAAHGVPVLFGPHTQNVRASADALRESGGGCEVKDSRELADALLRLIDRPDERRRMGQAAVEAVRSQNGSVERTVMLLCSFLADHRPLITDH